MTFSKSFILKLLIGAFFCFVIFVSIVSNNLMTKIISNANSILRVQAMNKTRYTHQNTYNEILTQKTIITRNLFNVTGEIPAEDLEYGNNTETNFALVPCAPTSEPLPVTVLGIIYTNDPKKNLVTVQDPDVEGADVYHEGDQLLDNNAYSIYRIVNSTNVEFRYGSKKICRSLVSGLPSVVQNSNGIFAIGQNSTEADETDPNAIVLTHDYIESELGAGFSKIINTVRFAPSIVDGQTEGFKIFSIAAESLFEKIGLKNGDIITEINNQKLTDPSKGFLIYNSFQYDNQITINAKRGTERVTRKVIIK